MTSPSFTEYGRPANEQTLAALAAVTRRYLAAVSREDGETACALLSKEKRTDYGQAPEGCAAVVANVLKPLRDQYGPALADVTVAKARRSRGQAIAFFSAPGEDEGVLALKREGSQWRVGTDLQ